MIKRLLYLMACPVMGCLLLPSALNAQAKFTATRDFVVQGGIGVTNASPDYTEKRISGFTVYGTVDLSPHIGVEANYHDVNIITPEDIGESSFAVGPRFVFRHGRFEPYGKLLIGRASQSFDSGTYSNNVHSQGYWMYAFGGGLDIRFAHHINLRAIDFELQEWPTYSPNNLTPALITVGVAYRLR